MANSFFMGSPSRFERIQKYDPQRNQAFNQILQQALSGLSQSPDFAPVEQRELQRFQQDTVPGLAERFTSMGGQGSSGFAESLARGGSQLGTDLGALRSNYQLGQQQNLMQLLGMGLTPQEEIGYFAGQPGAAQGLAGGIGQGLGYALPALGKAALSGAAGGIFGGPAGAAGGAVSSLLSQLIKLLQSNQQQSQGGPLQYNQNIAAEGRF